MGSSTGSEKSNSSTLERKSSAEKRSSLESSQKINVERKSSLGSERKTKSSSLVPMNLRDSFFDDPFFQDNWLDIQKSQKNFFSKAEEEFKKRMDLMESSMNERSSLSKFFDMDREWMKRTEDGDTVMLSRQMKRQYPIPAGAMCDQ